MAFMRQITLHQVALGLIAILAVVLLMEAVPLLPAIIGELGGRLVK